MKVDKSSAQIEPTLKEEKKSEEEKNYYGASLVEYVLLVALIALVVIIALEQMGVKVSNQFSTFGNMWDSAAN